MPPDPNLPADTTGAPIKKWFEGEQRFELRFSCTLTAARSKLLQGTTHQKPVRTGFWEAGFGWEGEMEQDNVRFTITVKAGKGNFTYKIFAKLLESENGTVIKIVVRDTIASGFILIVSIFLIITSIMHGGIGITLFFLVVLGALFSVYVSGWQRTGVKKATQLFNHIIATYQ